ncbi:MAG: hypothetical protein ACTH3D_07415 [Halomonas sp.]|uniref:hypothetical protein n=1 Tax=Halomonas sp. TaxID=1486246 RepID=UPI003F92F33B
MVIKLHKQATMTPKTRAEVKAASSSTTSLPRLSNAGDDKKPRHKPLKDYALGYMHIDIKHLTQMPDEEQKRYLHVAIITDCSNEGVAS